MEELIIHRAAESKVFSETQSSPPVTSSASVDEGRSDRARPGYRLCVFVVSAVVLMVVLFLL
jgi:hypothetical protein